LYFYFFDILELLSIQNHMLTQ